MIILEWARFFLSATFIFGGLFVLGIATLGIYRFDYVLNRIHVAAKCDTLGILLVLTGLIIKGVPLFSGLKLILVVAFMWLVNPVTNHLIVRLEVLTNDRIDEKCKVIYDDSI